MLGGRTFAIYESDGLYRLVVTERQAKRAKLVQRKVQGYLSMKAAENDIPLVTRHLDLGRRITTFQKTVGSATSNTGNQSRRLKGKSVSGCVAKAVKRASTRKYKRYCSRMASASLVPIPKLEWDALFDSPANNCRTLRAASRDPYTRYLYFIKELESSGEAENLGAIENSIKYMKERKVTLSVFMTEEDKTVQKLRTAICTSSCYTLLLKAHFEEDGDAESNTEDTKFTLQNTSKEQLSRVATQCFLTLSLSQRLKIRAEEEIVILEDSLQLISEMSRANLKDTISDVLLRRNEFKIKNSMASVAESVFLECNKIISAKTIRKWYNEFKEFGLFKEDLRGCYERRSFLSEYNYSRKFELYLKNERHLTVDEAKRNLEFILNSNPPESDVGKKVLADLLPLSRSTVHRWMIKAGCKYEKASTSYYTDSHELESTKQDFRERSVSSSYINSLE